MAGGANQRVTYTGRIERIVEHADDIRSLFIALPEHTGFSFVPGQFISLNLPLANETRIRPYTIASSPKDQGPLEIVFNLVPGGPGSKYLFERKVGDQLTFTGPFGLFTLERVPDVVTVFGAEGTAIAPIRPMLRRALSGSPGAPLTLLYAARSAGELLYRAELEAWAGRYPHFAFHPILSAPPVGWAGLRGSLIDHFKRLYVDADSRRDRHFYLCSVGQGVIDLRDLLRKAGYARRAVQYERW